MSVVRMIDLRCDGCDSDYDDPRWTVADVRHSAKRDGWRHTREGRDICPECWDQGER